MDLELQDSVAVVTGASRGIGLEVVRQLSAEGVSVVAGARNVEALAGIDGVTAVVADLAVAGEPERLVGEAVARHGRVDVLVNNVGGAPVRLGGFLSLTDADFEASLQLNFFSALRATRAAVADMVRRGSGTIVNVTSVNAFFEPDGAVIDYGAAKAALVNAAKALSQELGPHGIRVTSVAPGPVATDLWLGEHGVAETVGAASGTDGGTVRDGMAASMATGRFTTATEVATVVVLLASPRTANVTGANWVIDGGLLKTT